MNLCNLIGGFAIYFESCKPKPPQQEKKEVVAQDLQTEPPKPEKYGMRVFQLNSEGTPMVFRVLHNGWKASALTPA